MSVRQLAEQDIKDDLRQHGKCFIAFREKLNPVMDYLVDQELKIREQWKSINSQ